MHRDPHDLSQIRPTAELDRAVVAGGRSRRRRRTRRPVQMARGPRPRSGRAARLFGRMAFGAAIAFVLVAAAASAFFYAVSPTELVRSELIRQVKVNTGRDLVIRGDSRFLFYPSIGVSLGDVTLSAPPGMSGGPMLEAKRIDVSVALMPLIDREVHVEHVALVRPVIDLRIDEKGRESWSFAQAARPVRYAALGITGAGARVSDDGAGLLHRAAAPAGVAGLPDFVRDLELRSLALTEARIRYRDERSGAGYEVADLNLRLSGRRVGDPVRALGDLVWQGEKVSFDGRLDALDDLLSSKAANARLSLGGAPASAGFEGTVRLAPEFEARGETRLDGQSVAAAARWFGTGLPNAGVLGGFRASGRLVANAKSVALNEARIALGDTRATGIILAEWRKKRPYLSSDLKITELDIDKITAAFSEAQTLPMTGTASAVPRELSENNAQAPQSIEDLLKRSPIGPQRTGAGRFSPQVRGYQARDQWSETPLDADALGLVDAKARLRIDGLKAGGLAVTRTVIRLALADRALTVNVDDLELYGGEGKGIVTVKPGGGGLAIGANFGLDKVAIQPLLKDGAQFETLAGQGDIKLAVSAAGPSQKAIAQALDGQASVTFTDGAIVGWNIAKILRGLSQGQISNLDAVQSEKTDFSELAASFTIKDGNAVTQDLRMHSPLLRVVGSGRIGIGGRDLDLALKPRLVSTLAGQGGARDASGLEVPVRLKGPWRAPRIAPDFGELTKDPAKLIDKARELGRQYKGQSVGDIVRGVLGDAPSSGQPGGDGRQDLIGRFLR